jgi:hypothetical protein
MRLAPAIAGSVDALSRQPPVFAVVARGSSVDPRASGRMDHLLD